MFCCQIRSCFFLITTYCPSKYSKWISYSWTHFTFGAIRPRLDCFIWHSQIIHWGSLIWPLYTRTSCNVQGSERFFSPRVVHCEYPKIQGARLWAKSWPIIQDIRHCNFRSTRKYPLSEANELNEPSSVASSFSSRQPSTGSSRQSHHCASSPLNCTSNGGHSISSCASACKSGEHAWGNDIANCSLSCGGLSTYLRF